MVFMKKKALLIGFSALATSLASFAGTPDNMQVWLKNGEQRAPPIIAVIGFSGFVTIG